MQAAQNTYSWSYGASCGFGFQRNWSMLTKYCANETLRNPTTRCHPEFFGAQRRKVSKDEQRQATITRHGFTGHEHLDKYNLINMNGRVYDPVLGRFLSPDPVTQDPNNTQNYNKYSYVLNNPLKYTDPSGYRNQRVYRLRAPDMDAANHTLQIDREAHWALMHGQADGDEFGAFIAAMYGGGTGGGGGGWGSSGALDIISSMNLKFLLSAVFNAPTGNDAEGAGCNNENCDNSPPVLINYYNETIYFKVENDFTDDNGKTWKTCNESYPLGQNEYTFIAIDGINVDGKTYKITNGYDMVTVSANGEYSTEYSNWGERQYYNAMGGFCSTLPDDCWKSLFYRP